MKKEVIAIEGGHQLNGNVRISGAKNATVALIPSIVLATEPVEIYGVPEISDVEALSVLLEELNCQVSFHDEVLRVDPTQIKNIPLVSDAVIKLRASYYFMGALLGRYKKVTIKMPGGCDLGPRPINLHLKGFEALGAKITYDLNTQNCTLEADRLIGTDIYLDFASVGATINIMLAAVMAEGRTVIH
ncbi:MAG: UDP-N-acetylglucosamine 1-carboxyvinyltransferase, partial [bacterium]